MINESIFILVDACDEECVDISYIIKIITEECMDVKIAHVVRLRKSGPIFQGEMGIEASDEMTIKEFKTLKNNIKKRITKIFSEIERITITAKTKDTL